MHNIPLIILGISAGLMLVGVLVIVAIRRKRKGETGETNYRVFFILGVTFFPLGILYEIVFFVSGTIVFLVLGLSFIAMGLPYLVIGLNNRDKWEKT